MPRSVRSNPLALAVMVCLLERPLHPYEVAQTLRSRGKQESVRLNYGSLYAVVESLERRGLIRAQETVRQGRRPERTVYQLTGDGARELNEWLSELVSVPIKEFPQFMAALSFIGALSPEEAQRALIRRAEGLELRLAQHRGREQADAAPGLPRLIWLESAYEDRQLETELDFVRALIKDIDNGSLDGIDLWRPLGSEGADAPMSTKELAQRP